MLIDPVRGVVLRAHREDDLPRLLVEARNPETQAWTTVPVDPGPAQAERFLVSARAGWADGSVLSWAITRHDDRYLGTVTLRSLRPTAPGAADLSFGLHPDARGQGVASAAVRLVVGHAFAASTAVPPGLGLTELRWEAYVGHEASLRVATAVGFVRTGTRPRAAEHRGEPRDLWTAALTPETTD